ncbi:MAG TPA: mechanosensitive ion channel family protein, partial [Candidatus Methylomirabilis sp.]
MIDLLLKDWQAWARSGVRALLVLVVAFALAHALRIAAGRAARLAEKEAGPLAERAKRVRTLVGFLRRVASVLIYAIALTMVLRELGVDITPIIAGAGLAGVALGFGAQGLIKDLISGVFILAEDQFRVGDVIKTAGVAGQVERITLRVTQVRDLEGVLHTVPNGEIKVVSNLTMGFSRVSLDVGVSYREDLDRAIKLLDAVGRELAEDPKFGPLILEPPTVLGVEALAESQVTLRLLAKTLPLQQWDVARELRKRIKLA